MTFLAVALQRVYKECLLAFLFLQQVFFYLPHIQFIFFISYIFIKKVIGITAAFVVKKAWLSFRQYVTVLESHVVAHHTNDTKGSSEYTQEQHYSALQFHLMLPLPQSCGKAYSGYPVESSQLGLMIARKAVTQRPLYDGCSLGRLVCIAISRGRSCQLLRIVLMKM